MKKIYNAVILAAGLGSRLKSLTLDKPKAMVKYKDKEIISYQIECLREFGINKIIIVTGYLSNKLISFIEKRYSDITFATNNEFSSTNSAYSFMYASDKIESESYIHINCDILFSKKILKKLIDSNHENAICARNDLVLEDKMENISIDKKDKINYMSLKKRSDSKFKGYGLAKISKDSLNNNLNLYNNLDLEIKKKENYFGLIRNNLDQNDYYIIRSDKYNLAEINSPEDLEICLFKNDI